MTMRVCVFGAGSLGSALGGMLAQKHKVTLIGRRQHVEAIRKHDLVLFGDVSRKATVEAFEDPSKAETPDLLIIATKAYDTPLAIRACRGLVDPGTKILTLQNGLGNLELLRRWRGAKAFGGTTTMGSALVSPGIVRVSGLGKTVIGSDIDALGAEEIAQSLRSCGLRAQVKRDVMREIWGKAVINACINPTAAVLRVRNGRLLKSQTIARFMRGVCGECEQVAVSSSISLPARRMFPRVRAVCIDTADNISSMLQDVQNGKRTEIQQINGAFCSAGKARGIPTPLNEVLVSMIESI